MMGIYMHDERETDLAVEECSTGDFVFVLMVIQVSRFGVVFASGDTLVAGSSPVLIVATVTQNTVSSMKR